ncbi:MAG: outer membrane beta-barrel protein [Reyranella sp.]|nr:outer membrane beta-barrel protein [Reyranella sp.]
MAINANRSQLFWSPVLGWALLSCLASGAQAQEETSTPALQTIEQQSPDDPIIELLPLPGGGSATREELGITMGAFTLFPSIEILGGYDSNVFATSAPTTGSLFTVIKPQLDLRSEWLNHSIRLLASGGFGFYASAPTQNFENYTLLAEGKLEIRQDFYVTGKVAAMRATEALGTPDVSFAQAPTVVDSIPVEVSLYQKFNRFFYQLTGAAVRYWYYDFSTITATGLPGTSRDRTDYEERIRLGYELFDGTSFFIAPGLQQRVYTQFINAAGQQRDSNSWFFNVGATTDLGPKSKLEGFIGYQSLSYIADGTSTGATTFGLTGSWNGYEPLVLRPQILRSINESALTNYQNYVSTTIGVDFTYDVHGPWQAVGGAAFNSADYTPAAGVANVNPRTDYFLKGSIGVMYSLRPQVQIGPLYEYTTGWSTDVAAGGPSYTRNMFSIRLVAKR